jgi:hypothetical protein
VINRRQLLGAAAVVAAARLSGQSVNEWGGPVLDMHLHFRQNDGNLAHIEGCGVTKANLLTPAASDADAQAAIAKHPGRYVRFVSANITEPGGIDQLRQGAKASVTARSDWGDQIQCSGRFSRDATCL